MNGHPTYEEFFDLYALGVLEGAELEEFRAHLASCNECARKVAEAEGRMAALSFSLEPVEPPAGAKQRLLEQVRAESKGQTARVPKAERGGERVTGWSWWTMVLAPVALALAIATIYLWHSNNQLNETIRNEQRDKDQLSETVRSESAQAQRLRSQLDEANSLMRLEIARDTVSVQLKPAKNEEVLRGRILYNPRLGVAFYTDTLPPPPADKTYQLWLVPTTGNPISAGIFGNDKGNGFHMLVKVPPGVAAKAFAVTLETAGGVSQPQGPKLLIGPIS